MAAAMRHFGEDGFERAAIRGIAVEAGVLVRHHFGSKQALREVCDVHLIKLIQTQTANLDHRRILRGRSPASGRGIAAGEDGWSSWLKIER